MCSGWWCRNLGRQGPVHSRTGRPQLPGAHGVAQREPFAGQVTTPETVRFVGGDRPLAALLNDGAAGAHFLPGATTPRSGKNASGSVYWQAASARQPCSPSTGVDATKDR